MKREIKEEYGFDIEVTDFIEVVDHIIEEEGQHWVSPSFVAKHVSGTPKILEPHKCSEIKWVELSEVDPELLTGASRSNYEKYVKENGLKPPKWHE